MILKSKCGLKVTLAVKNISGCSSIGYKNNKAWYEYYSRLVKRAEETPRRGSRLVWLRHREGLRFWIIVALTFGSLDEMIGGTWYDVAIDIFMSPRHALCERRDLSQGSLYIPQATVGCSVIVPRTRPRSHQSIIIPALSCYKMNERFEGKYVVRLARCETMRWNRAVLLRFASRWVIPMVVIIMISERILIAWWKPCARRVCDCASLGSTYTSNHASFEKRRSLFRNRWVLLHSLSSALCQRRLSSCGQTNRLHFWRPEESLSEASLSQNNIVEANWNKII